MLNNIFRKKRKYATVSSYHPKATEDQEIIANTTLESTSESTSRLPDGLWVKCPKCGEALFKKDLIENLRVCTYCQYHFRIPARERVEHLVDPGTFEEWDADLKTVNPLDFPEYEEKLAEASEKSDVSEAVLTGKGEISGFPVVLAINDADFMMGSMGSVSWGEDSSCCGEGH